jgi:hypothetical protein
MQSNQYHLHSNDDVLSSQAVNSITIKRCWGGCGDAGRNGNWGLAGGIGNLGCAARLTVRGGVNVCSDRWVRARQGRVGLALNWMNAAGRWFGWAAALF